MGSELTAVAEHQAQADGCLCAFEKAKRFGRLFSFAQASGIEHFAQHMWFSLSEVLSRTIEMVARHRVQTFVGEWNGMRWFGGDVVGAERHSAGAEGNRTLTVCGWDDIHLQPNESFVETPIEEGRMLWGRSPKPWLAQRQNSGFDSPDKRIENLIVT